MSKLLKCPFCGGEVYFATEDYNDEITHLICCDNCDLKFYGSNSYGIKDHIANHWNRRTPMANIVENIVTSLESEKTVFLGTRTEQTDTILIDDAINIVKQEINNGLE